MAAYRTERKNSVWWANRVEKCYSPRQKDHVRPLSYHRSQETGEVKKGGTAGTHNRTVETSRPGKGTFAPVAFSAKIL